jgi:hypothetical protein
MTLLRGGSSLPPMCFPVLKIVVECGLERRGANSARKHEKMTQTIFFFHKGGGSAAAADLNKHDRT